jgi:hypothetical protein
MKYLSGDSNINLNSFKVNNDDNPGIHEIDIINYMDT